MSHVGARFHKYPFSGAKSYLRAIRKLVERVYCMSKSLVDSVWHCVLCTKLALEKMYLIMRVNGICVTMIFNM